MVKQPERRCLPLEVEPVPLYRDSPQVARFRRDQRRQQRRAKGSLAARLRQAIPGLRRRRT